MEVKYSYISLEERKLNVNNIEAKMKEFKQIKLTGTQEEIDREGQKLLELHVSFLRLLHFTRELNRINVNDHKTVSLECLEALLKEQKMIVSEIEKQKKDLEDDLHSISNYFDTFKNDSMTIHLLKTLENTICSSNKVIRKKSRKFLLNIIEKNNIH